jgi:hypothetical protein
MNIEYYLEIARGFVYSPTFRKSKFILPIFFFSLSRLMYTLNSEVFKLLFDFIKIRKKKKE